MSRWDCDRFNTKAHKNITESYEPGIARQRFTKCFEIQKGSSSSRGSGPLGWNVSFVTVTCKFLSSIPNIGWSTELHTSRHVTCLLSDSLSTCGPAYLEVVSITLIFLRRK